jgi:flagellar hook-associated protein 3 FlgL
MSRISTFSASQAAIMDLMRTQRSLFESQQQLTTGKKASDLKGVGHQAESLSAARAAMVRAESYQEAGVRAAARLDSTAVALEKLGDSVTELRTAMTTKNGNFLMLQVKDAFYSSVNALNTKHGSAFIFGGTRSDQRPVNANELDDLLGMASAADAFDNNDRRPQIQLDQNISQKVGMLADDVGGNLMASFKAIADFNAGPSGPFADPMTDAQEAFMRTELQNILSALDEIHAKAGENGTYQVNVDKLKQGHADRHVFLAQMLGNLEDVDMAEAATRFQQAQTALDVSAKTFATLSQVSLLPFLR